MRPERQGLRQVQDSKPGPGAAEIELGVVEDGVATAAEEEGALGNVDRVNRGHDEIAIDRQGRAVRHRKRGLSVVDRQRVDGFVFGNRHGFRLDADDLRIARAAGNDAARPVRFRSPVSARPRAPHESRRQRTLDDTLKDRAALGDGAAAHDHVVERQRLAGFDVDLAAGNGGSVNGARTDNIDRAVVGDGAARLAGNYRVLERESSRKGRPAGRRIC